MRASHPRDQPSLRIRARCDPDRGWPAPRTWFDVLSKVVVLVLVSTIANTGSVSSPPIPPLDPAARLLEGDDATEYWSLYIELESGHRITQRFLLSNAGPGVHSAVAVGHLIEPGREPYRYLNGRREGHWTLSEDRLFLDIAASHLDLHRPTGELRITKDDIEIRLSFDLSTNQPAARVPRERLPENYHVDVLAIAAPTRGLLRAPWMKQPVKTTGRAWLAHTWSPLSESSLIDRRIEIYGHAQETSYYAIQVRQGNAFDRAWVIAHPSDQDIVESLINIPEKWIETAGDGAGDQTPAYPLPAHFVFSGGTVAGQITLGSEWLRFDPLAVIPQPFQWFIRRKTNPREVWADARIGVRLLTAPETPSLPDAGETKSELNSKREIEEETAERSVTGVASITFLKPSERR